MKGTLRGFTNVMSQSPDNNIAAPLPDPDTAYPEHEKPLVVIVGRPNVGKSTLFNRILGNRRAIVGDEPGITRDRIQGDAEYRNKYFDLIDTGGILPNDAAMIPSEIFKQASVALEDADHIIFVIDARTDITGADRELAQMLRRLGKPVALAVNKVDVPEREDLTGEFYSLGFDDLFPISAEHSRGIDELLDHVTQAFPDGAPTEDEEELSGKIKVAIIGRPNVGKSTLLNALVGEERTIVSPVAGTTRDAVDETVVHEGVDYDFVDTAGIRRKGKTHLMAEKLSVVMARRHIRMANVVLLVLDATEGVVGLDATIAGYAHEGGRAIVICVNKWDAISVKDQKAFDETIRYEMKFLEYAPVAYMSAKNGRGLTQLFKLIRTGFESATQRVPTGELNRFLAGLEFEKDLRVKYITQSSTRPPTFIVFTDGFKPMHFSTLRYLSNQIRKQFGFAGTPLVVRSKTKPKRKKK
jgi:GTPase